MRQKISLITILLFTFSFCVSAQQKEYEFKNFTQENGLPSNESYFIYRDSKAFLWIATDEGVVRYNGNKMERFNLPDNVVFKIWEDNKGRIWFFSHTGKLAYFFNGIIYPYKYNSNITESIKSILISDAYVNDNDEIFISSNHGKNYKISKAGVIETENYSKGILSDTNTFRITHPRVKPFFIQRKILTGVIRDIVIVEVEREQKVSRYEIPVSFKSDVHFGCATINEKDIYFFTCNVLVKLNTDGSFKVKSFPFEILSLYADKNLWVGFRKEGFSMFDSNLNIIYKDQALKNKSVTSFRKDVEGGVWLSTLEQGVFYLKNPGITHLAGDSTLAEPVFRLFNSNDQYFLYANKSGVYKLHENKIDQVISQNSAKITDLFVDKNKNLYLAGTISWDGLCTGKGKKSKEPDFNNLFILNSVSEMAETDKDNYLVCNFNFIHQFLLGPNLNYNKNSPCLKHSQAIHSMVKTGNLFCDSKKRIWMGTVNSLYKVNSIDKPFEEFRPGDTLFKKGVTCMRQFINGIYSIGIRFGGIVLMQDTIITANITESNGLLSNSVKYLLPVNDQLWAATAKGISVISFTSFNPVKYTITNIGKNNGLYNQIIYQLIPYQGNILAATSNGIYEINDADRLIKSPVKPIPFYINAINYYKGDTSGINTVSVPYNNSRVTIKFNAVCFNLPEEMRYYYRFDNRDTNWFEIKSTELVMENLIPGSYNLEIKAAIPVEGRYSDVQKLRIVVEKPWWQSSWLILAAIIIITGGIYFIYKNRVRKITAREEEKTVLKSRMIELEQTALRAQMNPHFIFNCLTSIQQLVITGNKAEANEYLVRFARLIRKTLELSGRSFITIDEETDYLNEYLILEQLRIPGQFDFSIYVDPDIDTVKTEIPNMMLQPIIENSIRHGIKHLDKRKGFISIKLQKANDYIICTVSDNGIGRKKTNSNDENAFSQNKSYGMDIVNKRLEILNLYPEKENTISIEDLYNNEGLPTGTTVTMQLPIKNR